MTTLFKFGKRHKRCFHCLDKKNRYDRDTENDGEVTIYVPFPDQTLNNKEIRKKGNHATYDNLPLCECFVCMDYEYPVLEKGERIVSLGNYLLIKSLEI